MGSYVDDGFGGALTQANAQVMIDELYAMGRATGTIFNMDKTHGPATRLVILGLLYCSVTQSCRIGEDKLAKYSSRVALVILRQATTSKALEKIVGNLGYAAWVEPFGRPFLTFLAHHINHDDPKAVLPLTPLMTTALRIWFTILRRNRGLPYAYILGLMPKADSPIFVDAASLVGLGGLHGSDYFMFGHADLREFIHHCPGWAAYPCVPIAWLELLAVLVALSLFGHRYPRHLIVLYSDNTNVIAWLGSRRSPNPVVSTLVAAIDRIKYKFLLKLSVRFIPSSKNVTADSLSRARVPQWLRRRGTRIFPCMSSLAHLVDSRNLVTSWISTINNLETCV